MSQGQTTQKTCCEDGCEKPSQSRGMCRNHYSKWWYQQNRDSRNATSRKYYEQNREAIRERTKEAHQRRRESPEYREAEREANRRRYYADPEKARKKARDWHRANPDKGRARARADAKKKVAARFGLTVEELEAILARGCAICGASSESYSRGLHLDHDHTSGKARDALCHGCNTSLGLMKDDPARLRAAADYIESHR